MAEERRRRKGNRSKLPPWLVIQVQSNLIQLLQIIVGLQAELVKKYFDEQLPGFLANFEKLLTANNNGDGYFIGTEVGDNKPNNTALPMTA